MSRHFLVTGGSGFIGSGVVLALVRRGDRVRCFDNNWRGSFENLREVSGKVEFVQGDIRDPKAVSKAVKGVDAVLHLAAINGTEHFYKIPDLILEVAVKGMLNIVDACKEHHVRDLVVMSSSEVYQVPSIIPTPETVPLVVPDVRNPRYSYGSGKIISEMIAMHAGSAFDSVRIVRPHNVYGPAMGWEHVVPQLISRLYSTLGNNWKRGTRSDVQLPIQGSGEETRAFVFIDDMVAGFLLATDRGEHRGIYHVGTEQEVRITDLARQVGRCLGVNVNVRPGDLQKGGTPRRCPDIRQIQALGYKPQTTLQAGLEKTVSWYWDALERKNLEHGKSNEEKRAS